MVIVPSDYFFDLVSRWGVKENRIKRIYNGVSVPEDLSDDQKREKVIVSAGRLVPWKGFDELLKILKDLPDYKLEIFGDGEDKKRLLDISKELGVYERVSFMGQVDRKILLSHIKSANVFVLASHFESFSFQIVESMMVGTPVIAYDIGNLSEIVKSGENGILVEEGNTVSMRDWIVKISEKNDTCRLFSERAITDSNQFALSKTVDQLEEILNKI